MRNISIFAIVLSALFSCESEEQLSEAPYKSYNYNVFFPGNPAGYFKSQIDSTGTYQFVFEFNDRGRGPHLEESIDLNAQGVIESLTIRGHNYLKDTVNEYFTYEDGTANWKSSSESGSADFNQDEFYVAVNGTYGSAELMVQKLLRDDGRVLELLPSGTVRISGIDEVNVKDTLDLKLIELTGLSFSPTYYWMDENDRLLASVSTWLSCVREGYDSLYSELLELQTKKQQEYYQNLAEKLTKTPDKKVVIKNVSVFDAEVAKLDTNKHVIIESNKITAILDGNETIEGDVKVIDGTGKTLLPGLIDSHTHINRSQGILNLAAGVTSVRDMANSLDLPEIQTEFDNNQTLGPRILLMSGFIDKAGPYAGPTGKIVKSLEEALDAVSFYHERGYQQIKLYSSIEPEWVEPIAKKTKSLNMRLSGHIPAHMLAEEAVLAGYDEIQHINMVALNFLPDTIDTRTPLRFSMVGQHAHAIDVAGEDFEKFLALLKRDEIVIDPTVSIFEGMLTTKAGEPDPMVAPILDRLPVQVKRGFYSGGLPVTDELETLYKASFNKLLEMVAALHDHGITIVPGTDALPGFALHTELENYVKAGIAPSEVLKMATITAARVINADDRVGSIAPGKLADVILINGNPLNDISDIRKVDLTIKDGKIYDPEALYEAIGVKHYQ